MEGTAFFQHSIDGVTVAAAIGFVAISAAIFIILRLLRGVLLRYLVPSTREGGTSFNDLFISLVRSTNTLFLLFVALYCGSYALPLQGRAAATVSAIIEIAVLLQLGIWSIRVVFYGIDRFVSQQPQGEDARLATAMGAITFLARVIVWSFVGLLILSALKINITALVTGLGIGGVAVALAAQNILGDLFASLSILLDRPFSIGHFIVYGDVAGTVEHVGIKSTRIRSLSGEEIVQSNSNLLNTRIHNYRHLSERRILFGIGVTYDTPLDKLKDIPGMVRDIIQAIEQTRFDRAHFKAYGDSALNFEIVYYVLSPDYNLYMDIQQRINLELFRRFQERKIEFAFPTRTLYVTHMNPEAQIDASALPA